MNTPALEKAVEAFSRFYDDHPNMSEKEAVPAIQRIMKRFGLVSVDGLIAATQKEVDECKAKLAELEKDENLAAPSKEAFVGEPIGAVEQLMLTVLLGDYDGRSPLTKEQREFFSSMPFGYDAKRCEFFIRNARGKRLTIPCC